MIESNLHQQSAPSETDMVPAAICRASPSLALLKYWGKTGAVRPATTSIAITLKELYSTTKVWLRPASPPIAAMPAKERWVHDRLTVDAVPVDTEKMGRYYAPILTEIRRITRYDGLFVIESTNNFPADAGIASSSSGMAALGCACMRALGRHLPDRALSRVAQIGSGSAARAIYGGITCYPARRRYALQIFEPSHWPSLRVVIAIVRAAAKPVSSREGMRLTQRTSPYYRAWVRDSASLVRAARHAIAARALDELGVLMRLSYLRMHATMIAANPPLLYWIPETIQLIRVCEQLRAQGIAAWETMDAGPQVKIITTADDMPKVHRAAAQSGAAVQVYDASMGEGVSYLP